MAAETPLPARADIRRILIIKWSALGDVVIASAIMEDVARAFPHAELHLNTLPNCLGLFADDPRFAAVFAIDVRNRQARWHNLRAWLRRVRAGDYDLIIDLQATDRSRVLLGLLRLTGARTPILLGNCGGLPYTRQPALRDPQAHALAMMRSVLTSVGIPAHTETPRLYPNAAALAQVAALRARHGLEEGRYVVLLPGSQAAGWLKRWGVARFQALARLLHGTGQADKVVVIGGPDEVPDCAEIASAGDYLVNLNGQLGLLQIAPLCAGARAVIGNDTGTAHFAAAAERPMLVLCGPTDPRRVKPIGARVRALQAQLPCRNCYATTCRLPEPQACLAVLTPEFVAAELDALLHGGDNPLPTAVPVLRVQQTDSHTLTL